MLTPSVQLLRERAAISKWERSAPILSIATFFAVISVIVTFTLAGHSREDVTRRFRCQGACVGVAVRGLGGTKRSPFKKTAAVAVLTCYG